MKNHPVPAETAPPIPERASSQGFSLIEVLVAAVLLLVIALGLVPLFTRAMIDNANGRDATTATNFDRSQIETLSAIPFHFAPLTLPANSTVLQTDASWSRGDPKVDNDTSEGWQAGLVANTATTRWTRTTRVRQFGILDLADGVLDNPLPGNSVDAVVQLKEIEVSVQGYNTGSNVLGQLFGSGPRVSFRFLRSI